MTRDEAALILHPDTTISALEKWDNSSYEVRMELVEEACRIAAEVLRHRQPDAETGLMPCGCGGKAEIRKWEWSNDTYIAGCTVCDANVDFPYNIDETDKIISDWNRAMGWKGGAEMTRDEAAQELANLRDRLVWDVDNKNETRRAKSALNAGIEAIVGKQPDAETGLMPCGCGGVAEQMDFHDGFFYHSKVECPECGIEIMRAGYTTEEAHDMTKEAWNTSMGLKGAGNDKG